MLRVTRDEMYCVQASVTNQMTMLCSIESYVVQRPTRARSRATDFGGNRHEVFVGCKQTRRAVVLTVA